MARILVPILLTGCLAVLSGCGASHGPVSGARAYDHTAQICSLGPRPPGSENLKKAAAYIEAQLAAIDPSLQLKRQPFEKFGERFENLWVEIPGSDPTGPILAIGAHYDSKITHPGEQDFEFVGALDAAASCGVLIELARAIHTQKPIAPNVWLLWFDGEESLEWEWNDEKALMGSTHWVETMHADTALFPEGLSKRLRAFVLLDLLGDVNLKIDRDLESNPKLLEIFKDTASEMGKSGVLYRYESPMKDDHIPFKRKSVRVIDLIDFQYRAPVQHGPNTPEDGKRYTPWWHTADDTLDKVSKDSLDFVGNLVFRALPRIEAEFYR
ncbi:MAG: M28 family peptidase [Planctomycetota bacterium]|nr:M28 family peptidase [Planctomycetota bacterium]MDA0931888.1 M28 family peptidase [Planctomycetota bacterium]MDA1220820.1 M28 family peptidase [Planctomycetota bacterium]